MSAYEIAFISGVSGAVGIDMFHVPLCPMSVNLFSFFVLLFSKKKNAVEAYSLPPFSTQAAAELAFVAAAVVRHFIAAEVPAVAFAAPVGVDATAAAAAAPVVVFDVAAAGFPADVASAVAASDFYIDVASAVAAAFHPASAVGVATVASVTVGHPAGEARSPIFVSTPSPSATYWGQWGPGRTCLAPLFPLILRIDEFVALGS